MKTFSLNNQFGELLKELRKKKGWSLRKAAEEIGISHTYINQLEKGTNTNLPPEYVRKLANAYDQSYNYLMVLAGYKEEVPYNIVDGTDEIEDLEEYMYFHGEDYYDSLKSISVEEPNEEWLVFSDDEMETIGDRVKLLRDKQKLSINDLSVKLTGSFLHHVYTVHTKFTPTYIQDVEKGKQDPSSSFMIAICDFFSVSMDWLATGKEYKSSPYSFRGANDDEYKARLMEIARRNLEESMNLIIEKATEEKINEIGLKNENKKDPEEGQL